MIELFKQGRIVRSRWFGARTYPFYSIVASLGRSGSTLFYDSLRGHLKPSGHATYSFVRDLERFDFKPGFCYKTHDHAPPFLPPGAKVVFLFSNPLHILLSLKSCEAIWGEQRMRFHFDNMKADYSRKEHWFREDILGLERMFDGYYGPKNYCLMTLRYETMWDYQREIAKFLGIPGFRLPPRKPRKALEEEVLAEEPLKAGILGAYRSLIRKIQEAEDLKIWHDPQ